MERITDKNRIIIIFLIIVPVFSLNIVLAQNPIIPDQFTADRAARFFGSCVYFYPSHDILAKEGQGHAGWFYMEDYLVFSSDKLTDWTDHGVIISQNKFKWADSTTYSMWAPDTPSGQNGWPCGCQSQYSQRNGVE